MLTVLFLEGLAMKHFLILLLVLLLGYAGWALTTPRQHALGRSRLSRHGPRVLLLAAVLVAALVTAFFFPAFKLL